MAKNLISARKGKVEIFDVLKEHVDKRCYWIETMKDGQRRIQPNYSLNSSDIINTDYDDGGY